MLRGFGIAPKRSFGTYMAPQRICKRCGVMAAFKWAQTSEGWKLTLNGLVHLCHPKVVEQYQQSLKNGAKPIDLGKPSDLKRPIWVATEPTDVATTANSTR